VDGLRPRRGESRKRRSRGVARIAPPFAGRGRGRPLRSPVCLRADLMPNQTYATTQVKPGPQGNAALVLEGKPCGLIANLSGGDTYADVIEEEMGPSYAAKKHLGVVRYDDFTLDIGFAMSQAVFDWIAASWRRENPRMNGSVVACDWNMEAKSERQFFNALITETTIPALDASAKNPAFLTLKFAPESVKTVKASGKVSAADSKHPEKILSPKNFKLEIGGLDCSKVS